MDYDFQKLNKKHVILLIGYGAEKDTRLHRADTGTPVRRRIQAERRGSPAACVVFQREPACFFWISGIIFFHKNHKK